MKWVIIDVSFLCYRAFYSFRGLTHNDVPTGIIYGFMREVVLLSRKFRTEGLVFCFDKGVGVRTEIYPAYKQKRKTTTDPEEIEIKREVARQIGIIRDKILPAVGYENIFFQSGYESDDVIASITQTLPKGDSAVMISADADLLQLIQDHVTFYDPKKDKEITRAVFKKEYGIEPSDYWKVKTLAGCTSDEVPGIPGVGEKTAIKYLRGELKATTQAHQKITAARKEGTLIRRNRKLTKLPFPGTYSFRLKQPKKINEAAWKKEMRALGIKTVRVLNLFSKRNRLI